MQTQARLDGNEWVVNGTKMFTTNGGYCDLYFLFAKPAKGPSAFLVDSKKAKSSKDIEKIGVRASVTSEVVFAAAKVQQENLLRPEREGFAYAKTILWG